MAEESDAKALATTLNNEADVKAAVADGIVAFMGHGNPEGYDYYGGNVRYIQLEEYLRAINPKYYVGTVDMDETYAEDVLKHIAGGKFDYKIGETMPTTIWLIPMTMRAGSLCSMPLVSRLLPMRPTSLRLAGNSTRAVMSTFLAWQSAAPFASCG